MYLQGATHTPTWLIGEQRHTPENGGLVQCVEDAASVELRPRAKSGGWDTPAYRSAGVDLQMNEAPPQSEAQCSLLVVLRVFSRFCPSIESQRKVSINGI
eukprot:3083837-Amphidinium_carterae.1